MGAYSVVEVVSNPGDSTPMHVHQNEHKHILIVEGTARIAYGDKIYDAAAGTVVTLTRQIPHAWGNATESALRVVIIATPGGCEEVLRAIAVGDDVDLKAISEKFSIQIVGPAPFTGGTRFLNDLPDATRDVNTMREAIKRDPRGAWPPRSRP
jgi:hypothetical protein